MDGLTKEEIARFAPEKGDYVLVSRDVYKRQGDGHRVSLQLGDAERQYQGSLFRGSLLFLSLIHI